MKRTGKTVVTCPFCGSKNIAKYIYGLVDPTFDMIFNNKIAFGGCIVVEDISPKYLCNNCEKSFGIYKKSKERKVKDTMRPSKKEAKMAWEMGW